MKKVMEMHFQQAVTSCAPPRTQITTKATIVGLGLLLCCALIAKADEIYVGNFSTSAIESIDSSGNASVFAYTGIYQPSTLAFDDNGYLYEASSASSPTYGNQNLIYKYDPEGNATIFASTDLNAPDALAFDASGNLYAANFADNNIVKFDSHGNSTIFVANTGITPSGGMAFDNSGNLYVALEGSYSIEKYDSQGNGSLFATVSAPYAMAFYGGDLYVATGFNDIYKFDMQGHVSLFADSGLDGPAGMAFDSSGNLYVVNSNNKTITKFDSQGTPSLFATENFYMDAIAIRPIPEPSLWTLLMLGAGASLINLYSKNLFRFQVD